MLERAGVHHQTVWVNCNSKPLRSSFVNEKQYKNLKQKLCKFPCGPKTKTERRIVGTSSLCYLRMETDSVSRTCSVWNTRMWKVKKPSNTECNINTRSLYNWRKLWYCGIKVLILKRNVASFSILYHEDGGSIFIESINKFMPHYMASHRGCYSHQRISPVTAGLHIPWFGGLGSLNKFICSLQIMHCVIKGHLFYGW